MFACAAGLVLVSHFGAFAQEPEKAEPPKRDCPKMKGGMKGKCCMMRGNSMTATSDGGLIVMSGNKLLKYDKDLNLLKEVEYAPEKKCMRKMMKSGKEETSKK